MILTEKIEVKINKMNINHYILIGYDVKLRDIAKINTKDLIKGSKLKIDVRCDVCNCEKKLSFDAYISNFNRGGFYSCKKCKHVKTKKTNLEKYGVEFFVNPEKSKQTNLKNYGVENVSQSKQIKNKKKETNIKNWGTENVFQSEKIKEIAKKTKKEKYGDEHFTNREKSKKTCFKNNGVEWPTQSKEILKKRNINNKNKWGVEHYQQTEECQKRVINTCLEKYGEISYLATEDCQIKSRETCRQKYGVDYPSQNIIIHRKQFPKMKMHEIGIKYQGSYEKDFLDLCQKINLEVKRGKTIKYQYLDKEKFYFSDFYLNKYNLIVEVKSWYIYELHKEQCIAKELAAINQGYNFILVMNKNYEEFLQLIK
jgi:hypothetical protein